jgi:hypothetical protein
MIDLYPALGEQLLHIAPGQAVAQLPAHRDRDHLPREAVTDGADKAALELNTAALSPAPGRNRQRNSGPRTNRRCRSPLTAPTAFAQHFP